MSLTATFTALHQHCTCDLWLAIHYSRSDTYNEWANFCRNRDRATQSNHRPRAPLLLQIRLRDFELDSSRSTPVPRSMNAVALPA